MSSFINFYDFVIYGFVMIKNKYVLPHGIIYWTKKKKHYTFWIEI